MWQEPWLKSAINIPFCELHCLGSLLSFRSEIGTSGITPRSKCLLISWLQSLLTVILEPQMRKSITTSTFPLLFAMTQWGQMPWSYFCLLVCFCFIFSFWFSSVIQSCLSLWDPVDCMDDLVLCWLIHSPFSPSSRGSLVPVHFLALEWYHPYIWGCWCFSHLS